MTAMFAGSELRVLAGCVFTALLVVACISDLRTRRIPNVLSGLLAALGVAFSLAVVPGLEGLGRAGLGLLVGLGIWFPFWLFRWLGAGDVKLFAAAGAWLGPAATLDAAVIAALLGGLLAAGWLAANRGLKDGMLALWFTTIFRRNAVPTGAASDKRSRVPYGVPLAAGLLIAAWLPGPLLLR